MQYKLDWEEMEEFKGVDLFDSFIESWELKDNQLVFNFDASIWPGSDSYEKPKKNEYTCYKKAKLEFSGFNSINGLKPMAEATTSTDATGEKDYGEFEYFAKTKNGFEIHGEFGQVIIQGGKFVFQINA